jgi:hypothetical protein
MYMPHHWQVMHHDNALCRDEQDQTRTAFVLKGPTCFEYVAVNSKERPVLQAHYCDGFSERYNTGSLREIKVQRAHGKYLAFMQAKAHISTWLVGKHASSLHDRLNLSHHLANLLKGAPVYVKLIGAFQEFVLPPGAHLNGSLNLRTSGVQGLLGVHAFFDPFSPRAKVHLVSAAIPLAHRKLPLVDFAI